jgi:hypothetical protein
LAAGGAGTVTQVWTDPDDVPTRTSIGAHLPAMWLCQSGDDANRFVPVLLRMHALQNPAQAKAGRLLRLLLVWIGEVPADAAGWLLLRR